MQHILLTLDVSVGNFRFALQFLPGTAVAVQGGRQSLHLLCSSLCCQERTSNRFLHQLSCNNLHCLHVLFVVFPYTSFCQISSSHPLLYSLLIRFDLLKHHSARREQIWLEQYPGHTVIIEGLLLYRNFEVVHSFVWYQGFPQNPSCTHLIYDPFMGETDQHGNLQGENRGKHSGISVVSAVTVSTCCH